MRLLEEEIGHPKELVFLDLEGTQLSHETIAIGACCYFCDEHLLPIAGKPIKVFKKYVKSIGSVGVLVSGLTGITDDQLAKEGIAFSAAISQLVEFTKCQNGKRKYITFGNQDLNMLRVSSMKDPLGNASQFYHHIKRNWFDLQAFLSDYIHDDKHRTYSQPKLLEIFHATDLKHAHDPLYDAENLMNLFIKVSQSPDVFVDWFIKNMTTSKKTGEVLLPLLAKLAEGKNVTGKEFHRFLLEHFS